MIGSNHHDHFDATNGISSKNRLAGCVFHNENILHKRGGWVWEVEFVIRGFVDLTELRNIAGFPVAHPHDWITRVGGLPFWLLNGICPFPLIPSPGNPVPLPCEGRNAGPLFVPPPFTDAGTTPP